MVYGVERFMPKNGEGASSQSTDEEGAKQARSVGYSNIIYIVFGQSCIIE